MSTSSLSLGQCPLAHVRQTSTHIHKNRYSPLRHKFWTLHQRTERPTAAFSKLCRPNFLATSAAIIAMSKSCLSEEKPALPHRASRPRSTCCILPLHPQSCLYHCCQRRRPDHVFFSKTGAANAGCCSGLPRSTWCDMDSCSPLSNR